MPRQVKGSLFVDYVRMIRGNKHVDWSSHLTASDLALLSERIELEAWYPMETFERLGKAILAEIAANDLELVRIWGRMSVDGHGKLPDGLLAPGNPRESMMRFKVFRSTFFDFEAVKITTLLEQKAQMIIDYHMGRKAEEAAAYQTMGFFERMLELAGARAVEATFLSRRWIGEPRTVLLLAWQPPDPPG